VKQAFRDHTVSIKAKSTIGVNASKKSIDEKKGFGNLFSCLHTSGRTNVTPSHNLKHNEEHIPEVVQLECLNKMPPMTKYPHLGLKQSAMHQQITSTQFAESTCKVSSTLKNSTPSSLETLISFDGSDFQLLLQAKALASLERDRVRLTQIQDVFEAVLLSCTHKLSPVEIQRLQYEILSLRKLLAKGNPAFPPVTFESRLASMQRGLQPCFQMMQNASEFPFNFSPLHQAQVTCDMVRFVRQVTADDSMKLNNVRDQNDRIGQESRKRKVSSIES
jgi:hypothetical protein